MKLPEDKKERTQILALIMIGVVAVIYALYQLQVNMIAKPRKLSEKEISRLENDIKMAETDISFMETDIREIDKMMNEIKEINNSSYILHPRLGDNYLLSAQEFIEELAQKHEIKVKVSEIGASDIQQKTSTPKEFSFKTYTVRVEFQEGLHKTIEFLKDVETSNPYFCICSLNIASQKDVYDKHDVFFDVQWPIWIMNDLSAQALQVLRNENESKIEPVSPVLPLPPINGGAGDRIDPSTLIKPGGEA